MTSVHSIPHITESQAVDSDEDESLLWRVLRDDVVQLYT